MEYLILLLLAAILVAVLTIKSSIQTELYSLSFRIAKLEQLLKEKEAKAKPAEEQHSSAPSPTPTERWQRHEPQVVRKSAPTEQTISPEAEKAAHKPISSPAITTPKTDNEVLTAAIAARRPQALQPSPLTHQHTKEEKPQSNGKASNVQFNLEKFVGENLFGKIGILIFVIGIAFFVKYAIDKNWINELVRTIISFSVGAGMLLLAQSLHKRYRTFSSLLAGGSFAVFNLTTAIAFQNYHLFSHTTAFALLVFITAGMTALSVLYNRKELAVVALVGGFLAPFIASTGTTHLAVLLIYMGVLNSGMLLLSLHKQWSILPPVAFVFTYIILLFDGLDRVPLNETWMLTGLIGFFLLFLWPVYYILQKREKTAGKQTLSILMGANGFVFLLFTRIFIVNIAHIGSYVCLFAAAAYLCLYLQSRRHEPQRSSLSNTLLALSVLFTSLFFPQFFEAQALPSVWMAESIILLWLYIHDRWKGYGIASGILLVISCILLLVNEMTLARPLSSESTMFANSFFASCSFTALLLTAYAVVMQRNRRATDAMFTPFNALIHVYSITQLIALVLVEIHFYIDSLYVESVQLCFLTFALLAVSILYVRRFRIERYPALYPILCFAGVFCLLFPIIDMNEQRLSSAFIPLYALSFLFTALHLAFIGSHYHAKVRGRKLLFNIFFNFMAVSWWLGLVRYVLLRLGIEDFTAGFALAMSVAGIAQMTTGVRHKNKHLRMMSLALFSLVLVKLVLLDVWLMPVVGRIIVFILIGLTLLILSFMYQKLKTVLFGEEVVDKASSAINEPPFTAENE